MGYIEDNGAIGGGCGCGIDNGTEGVGTVLGEEGRIRGEAGSKQDSGVLGVGESV